MFSDSHIKRTIVCKKITDYICRPELTKIHTPKAGDVALFEVLKIGKHKVVQCDSGRNVTILPGDIVMAAFGNRYATAQFEGYVPETPVEEIDILGAGGVVGILKSKNAAFEDIQPTKMKLLCYVTSKDDNQVLNSIGYGNNIESFTGQLPENASIILSLGASMDSGKTTTAAYLINGLKKQQKKVGFIKLTGTCYTKDKELAFDCGAEVVFDFGDLGYPSTFLCNEIELLNIYQTLVNRMSHYNLDYIVMEIADGLFQRETSLLLNNKNFTNTISNTIFSSGDSLSAIHGISWLSERGLKPFAIGGLFTMSPLLIEEVGNLTSVPVFDLDGLVSEKPNEILTNNKRNAT